MNEPIIIKKNKIQTVWVSVRKKLKYIIPLLIIIAGVCVMFYPWFNAQRFDALQRRALAAWEEAINSGEIFPGAAAAAPGGLYNSEWSASSVTIGDFINDGGVWEEDTNPDFTLNYLLKNMEGVLIIEKIDLKTVILAPASKNNLDISVCAVSDSRGMGQVGNYILAGHYSRIYGRHLNRIRELAIGDIITTDSGYEKFDYQIIEIFSVDPSEVWVMADDDERKLITLITCDYETYPYNRLIVKGEIK